MAIPDHQTLMLPLLELAGTRRGHSRITDLGREVLRDPPARQVQRLAGALHGHRARKGVFITTSTFTGEARDYASRIDSTIVLIDGEQLVDLMIDHGIGVTPVASYEVKRVDGDYFLEA